MLNGGKSLPGKPPQNDEQAKPSISKGNAAKPALSEKPKVKVVGPSQDEDCEEDDSDDDDSDDDEEGSEDESDEVFCLFRFTLNYKISLL